MNRISLFVPIIIAVAATSSLEAQARGMAYGALPTTGVCQVWIENLPAKRQAAPTDCAKARRNVPPNARVVYEDESTRGGRGRGRPETRQRTFIDQNGLECVEKSSVNGAGKRKYDLKCKEPKQNNGKGRAGDDIFNGRDRTRACVDSNRDGRCDIPWEIGSPYPTTLPDMIGALLYSQGRRTQDVARWLGAGQYQMRYVDQNNDRRPERITWLDRAGQLVQEWVDTNRDGRADSVRIYR